jgi:hypothetical protein
MVGSRPEEIRRTSKAPAGMHRNLELAEIQSGCLHAHNIALAFRYAAAIPFDQE